MQVFHCISKLFICMCKEDVQTDIRFVILALFERVLQQEAAGMEDHDNHPADAGGQSDGVQTHGIHQQVGAHNANRDLGRRGPEGDIHPAHAAEMAHIGVSGKGQEV